MTVATERAIRVLELLVSTRVGGGPKQVFEAIRLLPRDEFTWIVAAPDDGPYFARFAGIATMHALRLDRLDVPTLIRVVRLIRAERVDVVHSHGKGAGLYGRLAAAWSRVPAIHTFHGIHAAKYGTVGERLYLALERALARLSYAIVNVSTSQARAGDAVRLWPAGRAVVIRNGVDTAAIRSLVARDSLDRRSLGVADGGPVIATIARLDPVKGVDVFVKAVARLADRHPGIRALVVGAGQEDGRLRTLAAELGAAARIVFAGEIADAVRVMPAIDVYVSASRAEGLPLGVLEAMACGVPVVATRIPAHEEIFEPAGAGLLATVDDPAGLAAAIDRVLTDADLRAGLSRRARETVDADWDVAGSARALGALYRRASATPRRGPRSAATVSRKGASL